MTVQACPICHAAVKPSDRYPRYLCPACSARATDASGRALASRTRISAAASRRTTQIPANRRDGHDCQVDGVPCRADEARFGGIVVQAKEGHATARSR